MTIQHHSPAQGLHEQINSALDIIHSDTHIADTHQSVTAIRVNQQQISAEKIAAEVQYHPAPTQREAIFKAAEALIIGELLGQRAAALNLVRPGDSDDEMLDALLALEVVMPEATDSECAQYYQANMKRFMTSPLLELRHILLAAAPDDDEARIATKLRAQQLITAIESGADFAKLAQQESACPSREMGGNLGQVSRGQTVTEFERHIFAAGPGLLGHPIESRYGIHVVWIERNIPGVQLPYHDAKKRIADYLNERVRTKALAQYIHTLIAQADIEGYKFDVSSSPLMQ